MGIPIETARCGIGPVKELHKPHATFNQSTGQNTVLGKRSFVLVDAIGTVKLPDVAWTLFSDWQPQVY